MPFPWSVYPVARTAGLLLVAALAGSALTHAVLSRLLLSDTALAAAAELSDDRPSADTNAEPADDTEARAAARERQLAAALEAQADAEAEAGAALIVSHNVFCPTCRPTPTEDVEPSKPAMSPTDLPLALVATMESDDPLASLATIRDTERRATGVFGIGDAIRPGVLVAGVQRGRVVLRSSEGLRTLGFPGTDQPKPKAKPKPKPSKPGAREIPGARDAIACSGNACTVDREFVEGLMKNPRLLTRQAKLVPAVEDGETRGFRVHRVHKGTLPRLLGLQNGDTLLAVNGTALDSMDQAISLYTKLRRASELSLTVERKGKVFERQISIR